jgi:hypothetical protein
MMHAVLFHQWEQGVKGRDWFDLEWYVRRGVVLHLDHLAERARQSVHWPADQPFKAETLQALLAERINRLDVDNARLGIMRIVVDDKPVEIWTPSYFHDLVQRIQVM